jgi:hypothetical protein
MLFRHISLSFAAVFLTGQLALAQSSVLTATMQNELDDLPSDNTAFFSAARRARLKIEIPERTSLSSLSTAVVTIIRPDGEESEARPDAQGLVTIENAEEGLHGIVANADDAHGAMAIYVKEDTDSAIGEGLEDPEPLRMPILNISESQLQPLLERVRNLDAPIGSLANSFKVVPGTGFRAVLGADGTLVGQVFSTRSRRTGASLAGTQITLFFGGQQVGSTNSDDSGFFTVGGIRPGVHGLVATGSEGYSAFAFTAVSSAGLSVKELNERGYVSKLQPGGERLPVLLVPPAFMPKVVRSMSTYYPSLVNPTFQEAPSGLDAGIQMPSGISGGSFVSPFTGGVPAAPASPPAGGTPAGSGGGAPPAGGGGLPGGGGLGGLAALGAVGGVIAATSDDDNNSALEMPVAASPALPPAVGGQ